MHIYVGGDYSTGTGVGAYQANQSLPESQRQSVLELCKVKNFNELAFDFLLPVTHVKYHFTQYIFVHGISVTGGSNNLLKNSGVFSIEYKNDVIGSRDLPGIRFVLETNVTSPSRK